MVDGRVLTRVVIQNIETCLRLKKNQIDQQIAKDLGSTAEWPRRPRLGVHSVVTKVSFKHRLSECQSAPTVSWLRRHWKTSWHESHWVSSKKTGASVVWTPVWRCWKMFEILSKCRADLFVPRYCDCHLFVMDLRKHSTFSHRGELGRNAVLSDHVEQCEIVLFGARWGPGNPWKP